MRPLPYDSIKEVRAQPSGTKGLALIAAGALALLVGKVLLSSDDEKKDNNRTKPKG